MSRSLFVFAFACVSAFGSFEIYLREPNKIPLYAQETGVWCGAASAQMMLEGFPNDVNHVYKQSYIWDSIQDLKVETSWYTDPDGLKNVMRELGEGSTWEAKCVKGSSAPLLSSMIKNLSNRKYPVTVLVYGSAHWIVVIGTTTDKNPNESTSIILEKIEAFDPWKAQHVLVSGSTWFQKYWHSPARTRGKWGGCYVAIQEVSVEEEKGRALEVNVLPLPTHGKIISKAMAFQSAENHLLNLILENPRYNDLSKKSLLEPRLVSHVNGAYYLIPIGDKRTQWSQGALMVNAYTGEWEGLSRFEEPFQYQEANRGNWFFTASLESPSPFFPAIKNQNGIVDYEGKVTSEIHLMQPGS